jgi:mono/diheme cytochrome c family protein
VGALVVLTTLLLGACGGGGSGSETVATSPKPRGALANDPEIQQGRRLFERYCAECHGFSGGGGTGPTFNDGRLLRDFSNVDAQVEFVKKGKGIMPSFRTRMSSVQIQAVVRYEREVLSRRNP